MSTQESTVQRSFRLSARTLELLDERARAQDSSRNALAEQLLGEGVRTERHPLIGFRAGGSGRRRPALIGTRLYVHDVIATLRGEDGSVEAAAEYLGSRSGWCAQQWRTTPTSPTRSRPTLSWRRRASASESESDSVRTASLAQWPKT